jgi:hypothetical protein
VTRRVLCVAVERPDPPHRTSGTALIGESDTHPNAAVGVLSSRVLSMPSPARSDRQQADTAAMGTLAIRLVHVISYGSSAPASGTAIERRAPASRLGFGVTQ